MPAIIDRDEHLRFAKRCFNETWTLLEADQRSHEDTQRMIHTAHASAYHWLQVGEPVHAARGAWQLSRVYAAAGLHAEAKRYGERCAATCADHDLSAFDRGFAHEAIARAELIAGNLPEAERHLEMAIASLADVEDDEDREVLEKDLAELREKVRARA